jgi:hypothetical protein
MRIKTSWISVGLVGLIITGFSIAFTAGLKTSASAHSFAVVNERVRDVEVDMKVVEEDLGQEKVRSINTDRSHGSTLHEIQIQQAVTNNTLIQMKETLECIEQKLDRHKLIDR